MKTITKIIGVFSILILFNTTDGFSQQLGEKVYWMATVEVDLGKLTEYHAFNSTELTPLMQEHGYKAVATWQTIVGNIEEVISISEFENMAAYHEARHSLLASEEWKTTSKKFDELSKSIKTSFLSSTPYSVLK